MNAAAGKKGKGKNRGNIKTAGDPSSQGGERIQRKGFRRRQRERHKKQGGKRLIPQMGGKETQPQKKKKLICVYLRNNRPRKENRKQQRTTCVYPQKRKANPLGGGKPQATRSKKEGQK